MKSEPALRIGEGRSEPGQPRPEVSGRRYAGADPGQSGGVAERREIGGHEPGPGYEDQHGQPLRGGAVQLHGGAAYLHHGRGHQGAADGAPAGAGAVGPGQRGHDFFRLPEADDVQPTAPGQRLRLDFPGPGQRGPKGADPPTTRLCDHPGGPGRTPVVFLLPPGYRGDHHAPAGGHAPLQGLQRGRD